MTRPHERDVLKHGGTEARRRATKEDSCDLNRMIRHALVASRTRHSPRLRVSVLEDTAKLQ